ncbi:tetratricopeptide (TPR) repeat protein [Hamadaea flava]|uniref:Tetratricopeptide repeat protein n=1 Tax=Hamadaea flava TaxID=1742688 RepID=A0ABV8LRF6_9ACTN|nr:hypothetical protein [Hamadaea flava]MCP2322263.1 tetratricopeptide (TPR) repeat protein [Hamadaea flava]
MRVERVTEEMIAEHRRLARLRPDHGLPELARCLVRFGWQINRENPPEGVAYFEEAVSIYRSLAAGGEAEHLNNAARALSLLGLQYSFAYADGPALAARQEAAALARRAARRPLEPDPKILMELACTLAEVGQFADAATVQLEVVDSYRARGAHGVYPQPSSVMWALLDMAIYLDLAGQTDASLEFEREALALQRRMSEAGPAWLATWVLWAAGSSLRFTDSGHPDEARGLLREAVAACDQRPRESTRVNFGFDQAVQASLFARSGARDERSEAFRPVPVGVDPDQPLQPVPGLSFHHWSFSVRQAYRAGLAAIDEAIAAITDSPARGQDRLAELGLLMRRRAIRASVLCHGPVQFQEEVVPVLTHSVSLERRLVALDPSQDTRRLIRALIDQAMGHLVAGVNNRVSDALSEALELHMAS